VLVVETDTDDGEDAEFENLAIEVVGELVDDGKADELVRELVSEMVDVLDEGVELLVLDTKSDVEPDIGNMDVFLDEVVEDNGVDDVIAELLAVVFDEVVVDADGDAMVDENAIELVCGE
jgi:hypothetical protein